jgi:hypothetical protein
MTTEQQTLLSSDTATATIATPPAAPLASDAVPPQPAAPADPSKRLSPSAASGTVPGAAEAPTPTADKPAEEAPVTQNKLLIVAKALRTIEQNIANIIRLLEEGNGELKTNGLNHALAVESHGRPDIDLSLMKVVDGRVVVGVFDGQQMVGSDGKTYIVPPNYASKSKLVEGDLLKLTITPKGTFIYKQIGPIERSRVMANLGFDPTNGEFYAVSDDRRWSVLKASVTYFKGEPDDEVVLLVPKNAPSKWAAVENIIKNDPLAGKM